MESLMSFTEWSVSNSCTFIRLHGLLDTEQTINSTYLIPFVSRHRQDIKGFQCLQVFISNHCHSATMLSIRPSCIQLIYFAAVSFGVEVHLFFHQINEIGCVVLTEDAVSEHLLFFKHHQLRDPLGLIGPTSAN